MNKNIKNALLVVGVAALVYVLFTSSKPIPKLSEAEKLNLFEQARGFRGGAAPSQEMLQEFQQKATQAQAKIDELKLRSEYEAYLKSKENEPLPQ